MTRQERNRAAAATILEQLGGKRFIAMTGASSFSSSGDRPELSFRIPSRNALCARAVVIELTPADEYTLRFYAIAHHAPRLVHRLDGAQADNLAATFTHATGLATHL